MAKRYLSDFIDDATIDSWDKCSTVLINTPTGSGKTWFVLNRLLPYAARRGKYVVYLCNRKVIGEQVIEDVRGIDNKEIGLDGEVSSYDLPFLRIHTYQYFESRRSFWLDEQHKKVALGSTLGNLNEPPVNYRDYSGECDIPEDQVMFFVFDEAHYFISDAQFNSGTDFWRSAICGIYNGRKIFITATPETLNHFLVCAGYAVNPVDDLIMDQDVEYRLASAAKELEAAQEEVRRIADMFSVYNMTTIFDLVARHEERKALKTVVHWIEVLQQQPINCNTGDHRIDQNIMRQVAEWYRQNNPKRDPYRWSIPRMKRYTDEVQKLNPIKYVGTDELKVDYARMDEHYFCNYEDLYDLILKTSNKNEKWLVFVDKKADGIAIEEHLNQQGCSAVFLSADSIKKRRGKTAYTEIIRNKKFRADVLIATEILDCGVSISDERVKNIIISHSRKSTFLQMIGRLRMDETSRINLFIKQYTAKAVYGYIHKLDQAMRALVRLLELSGYMVSSEYMLSDDTSRYIGRHSKKDDTGKDDKDDEHNDGDGNADADGESNGSDEVVAEGEEDGYDEDDYYDDDDDGGDAAQDTDDKDDTAQGVSLRYSAPVKDFYKRAAIFEKLFSNRSISSLITMTDNENWKRNPNYGLYPSFFGMDVSRTGFMSMLYDLSLYREAIKLYEGNDKDRAFYVRYQLGWLGKEYDISKWVGYKESMDAIAWYIGQTEGDWVLGYDMRREVFERFMLCSFMPNALHNEVTKYLRNGMLPGIKKLNAALREREIGYIIESRQRFVGGRRATYWRFVPDIPRDFDV